MLRFIAILVVGICTWANAAAAQVLPSYSHWQNQRGSTMDIYFVDPSSGAFQGNYVNNATGFQCRGLPGFRLAGRAQKKSVTFIVVWNNGGQDCHSTTVWTGTTNGQTISTKWVLKITGGGTLTGSDTFYRQ